MRHSKIIVSFFAITTAILTFLPINNYLRGRTKDYGTWFWVGQTVIEGGDIYADPDDFPFMYPPTAAVFFAILSYLGELPLIISLDLLFSIAWVVSLTLSVFLATGTWGRDQPLLYLLPGVCCLPHVIGNYLLGQPNLLLLALMLTAFVCLRTDKEWTAGALIALATAIKAFPLLAIGYLAYRRHWKATVSTLLFLIFLLIVVPSPFRGIRGNLEDLQTWTQGMLRYDAQSISQRPQRGFSFANQSLVAVAHRLLRPVNAHRDRDPPLFVNVADIIFRHVNLVIVLSLLLLYLLYAVPHSTDEFLGCA
jgi:hypothetical protein